METAYTPASWRAAQAVSSAITGVQYAYHPEVAAAKLDQVYRIPELIAIVNELVEEAKRDLASSPGWTGNTVRISKARLKELSNITQAMVE